MFKSDLPVMIAEVLNQSLAETCDMLLREIADEGRETGRSICPPLRFSTSSKHPLYVSYQRDVSGNEFEVSELSTLISTIVLNGFF